MAIKITQWELSEEEPEGWINPEEGWRMLLVKSAELDSENVYHLGLKDLQNNAFISLKYKLNTANENGDIVKNNLSRSTLITLGHAILGTEKGIPYPADIIGGVASGEVKLRDYNGKKYPNIYEFKPAPFDFVVLGTLEEQNYEGMEEDIMDPDGEPVE